jgi:hypothetical protein
MRKTAAAIGVLFVIYCWVRVAKNRQFYNSVEITIWLVMIGLGGAWCLVTLLTR